MRRDERFSVPTDVRLRKLGPNGATEKEERTIAHDLSRSGMRLLTSWSDLAQGDQVAIEEMGGGFSTEGVVRHVHRGTDQITRVGIEFVQNQAPARLVGTTASIKRPAFDTARSDPGLAPGEARPTSPLGGSPPGSRSGRTSSIPRTPLPPQAPPPVRPPIEASPPPSAPPPPAQTPKSVLEEIARVKEAVRSLVAESKIWEALECLSKAQSITAGTPEALTMQIMTLETQAKIPSLLRAAQQNLEELARSAPEDARVHSALGRIFWRAGLQARARVAFQRVAALEPSNREAAAALAILVEPTRKR